MWLRISLCLGLLVGAGCTRNTDTSEPTPQDLADALISITDLEGNWQESQRQYFSERSQENPSIDPTMWCPQAAEVAGELVDLAGQAGADVEMQNKDVEGGARLLRLQAWSGADAGVYLERIIEAVEICDGVEYTDENEVTSSTDVIDGRRVGDESVSWITRVIPPPNTQKEKFESLGRTTVARLGNIVMILQVGDANWTGTTETMAEDDWWKIVETAADKLKDL